MNTAPVIRFTFPRLLATLAVLWGCWTVIRLDLTGLVAGPRAAGIVPANQPRGVRSASAPGRKASVLGAIPAPQGDSRLDSPGWMALGRMEVEWQPLAAGHSLAASARHYETWFGTRGWFAVDLAEPDPQASADSGRNQPTLAIYRRLNEMIAFLPANPGSGSPAGTYSLVWVNRPSPEAFMHTLDTLQREWRGTAMDVRTHTEQGGFESLRLVGGRGDPRARHAEAVKQMRKEGWAPVPAGPMAERDEWLDVFEKHGRQSIVHTSRQTGATTITRGD